MKKYLPAIAIIISAVALVSSFLKIIPTVTITNESYVGVIVSLLAIIVAIVIGYQIYNVIEWRNEMKKLSELKDELEILKCDLDESKRDLMRQNNTTQAYVSIHAGLSCNAEHDYVSAIANYLDALITFMRNDDTIGAKPPLGNMEAQIAIIVKNPDKMMTKRNFAGLHSKVAMKNLIELTRTTYHQNIVYLTYKERIDSVFSRFESVYDKIPD